MWAVTLSPVPEQSGGDSTYGLVSPHAQESER